MRRIRVPNQIVNDEKLSLSARKLAAYFCAVSDPGGHTRKSIAMLSGLSGLSQTTVKAAVEELTRAHILTHTRKYRYDQKRGRLIFDRTEYVIDKRLPGGYALIPSDFFRDGKNITSAAFCVGLYLCQQASGRGRAFPSINRIASAVGVARATVCRALRQIRYSALFIVRRCLCRTGAYAANSYSFLHRAVENLEAGAQRPDPKPGLLSRLYHWLAGKINQWGSLIFDQPVMNLDNESFIAQRKKKLREIYNFE